MAKGGAVAPIDHISFGIVGGVLTGYPNNQVRKAIAIHITRPGDAGTE